MSTTADLTRSEETSWSVLSPDIVLPVQFADHDTNQAEKRLMLAVLEEAVATFQRNTHAKTRRGQRLFREAEEWIQSEDVWPSIRTSLMESRYFAEVRIRT